MDTECGWLEYLKPEGVDSVSAINEGRFYSSFIEKYTIEKKQMKQETPNLNLNRKLSDLNHVKVYLVFMSL